MAERSLEVIEHHKKHLAIAKDKGDRAAEGRAYCNLGNAYLRLRNFQQAIECHKKELNIVKELSDRPGEERAYANLGNDYRQLGNFQEAIEYHIKRLEIAKEVGNRVGEKQAYCNLGIAYHNLGSFRQALEYHYKCLAIAEEAGDSTGRGIAYGNIGNAYHRLGNFQQALEYHNKCLTIVEEVGDRVGKGSAYGNIGNALHGLSKFRQAIEYHSKQLAAAKEVGDRAGEGGACANLGNDYRSLGNYQHALHFHNKELSIAQEVGTRAGEGNAYGNLGIAYYSLGKVQQAIECHWKHLSIAKEVGDKAGEGRAYGNLGNAYDSLGNFKQAIECHSKQLSIAKEVGDRAGEGRTYGNLGIAYENLGNFEKAKEYHKKRLRIAEEVGDKAGEGLANGNLGKAYRVLGDFENAIEFHNKDLDIAKEVGDRAREGRAYGNLGNAYHCLGNFQQAIECHEKDISIDKEVGNTAGEGRAYCNLGNAYYQLGDYKQAIEYHIKGLNIVKKGGNRAIEGTSCYLLGCDFEALGSLPEALNYYLSSVEHFNFTRALLEAKDAWKISFRDRHRNAYAALWRILLCLQKTEEALCAAEQGRAQALMDALKIQYGFTVRPSASLEPKETITYISNKLTTQTVFVALQRNIINFWVLGKGNEVVFRQRKIDCENVIEDPVTDLLNTTLKKVGAGVVVKCENRSLDELRDDLPSNRGDNEEVAEFSPCTIDSFQPLYDTIIGPIADLIQNDELIIVPDGSLCLAPLAAMDDSIRIRTVPSLTVLKLITDSPEDYHSKSGALLVGDPCLEKVVKEGKPIYSQLPCAKKEVEMVGEILKIPPLTGAEATKKEVLEQITSVALVHIAAHGSRETGEIALAPNPGWTTNIPEEEDFMLKMSDVHAVQLKAKLIVLSCCHSGRGEVKSEGVVGIARAFLSAGARSVLASLWAISDKATMEFMKSFYQHLRDGKSASVALHQAMKYLRGSEKFRAAKYWAPFVLIGDDVTLEF